MRAAIPSPPALPQRPAMTMVVCPKILNTKWAIWSALVNDFVRAAEGVRARCVLAVAQCVRLSRPSDVASCHCERSEAINRL